MDYIIYFINSNSEEHIVHISSIIFKNIMAISKIDILDFVII